MPADTDYVIFFVVALLAVVGAGLLRVGLMNEDPEKGGYSSLSVLPSVLQQC